MSIENVQIENWHLFFFFFFVCRGFLQCVLQITKFFERQIEWIKTKEMKLC